MIVFQFKHMLFSITYIHFHNNKLIHRIGFERKLEAYLVHLPKNHGIVIFQVGKFKTCRYYINGQY